MNEMDSFKQSFSTLQSSSHFTCIYVEIMVVNLKFLKEKSEGSDRDLSNLSNLT